jgi:hypothetical protein
VEVVGVFFATAFFATTFLTAVFFGAACCVFAASALFSAQYPLLTVVTPVKGGGGNADRAKDYAR